MVSEEIGRKEYMGYVTKPIRIDFPTDKPSEFYRNNPDINLALRRIGYFLVDQGIDQLVEEYFEGIHDLNSVVSELSVLAFPKVGNLIIDRNDLDINWGDFRNVSVLLAIKKENGLSSDYLPLAFPAGKDLEQLINTMNEVIVGLSYQVKTEEDLNLLASFAKVCLVRIHPLQDGNGRLSRAFYRFVKKFVGYQNDIVFLDEKWPDIKSESDHSNSLYRQENEIFNELQLLVQEKPRYKERDFTYPDGVKLIDIMYEDIKEGLTNGMRKFIKLDDLRKSKTLVDIANGKIMSQTKSPQT